MSVRRVAVRGIQVEVEETGQGERPFVLVHGFTGSRDDWRERLLELAPLGRTITLDQRGHGGTSNSGDPSDYSFEGLVDDLAAVLDAIGVERCDLLGHSMGGAVALRFALAHRGRVQSLVAMDTAASPMRILPKSARQAAAELVRSAGMGALFKAMRDRAGSDANRPEAVARCEREMGSERFWARIERKLEQMDPVAFATLGEALAESPGVEARLGEIRCPSLVMVGAQDTGLLEAADALQAGLPDVRRVTIPDAAHSPQLENAPAWLDAIREHLARARA